MRIVFRLDCGPAVGSGHLIRCGALAEELAALGHELLFLCRDQVELPIPFPIVYLRRPYSSGAARDYVFPSLEDELEEISALLRQLRPDRLVLDHYGATAAYVQALRPLCPCLTAIVDTARQISPVDIVVNGNIYAQELDYGDIPVQLLGTKYTLLRRRFREIEPKAIAGAPRELYLTSGGADPLWLCKKLLLLLTGWTGPSFHLHLIIGPSFQSAYVEELRALGEALGGAELLFHADMAACMRDADLFLSASGSTLYELAACGVPSVSVILAEDQRRLAEKMHKAGATYNLGWLQALDRDALFSALRALESEAAREQMRAACLGLVDGYGARRVAEELIRWRDGRCTNGS